MVSFRTLPFAWRDRIIKRLIDDHPLALVDPGPLVFVKELGDNAVVITVKVRSPASEWYGVKMELLWKMKTTLEENDIKVPFPQRELWFNSELRTESGEI